MDLSLYLALRYGTYHLYGIPFLWNEECGGDGAYVVGIGEGFAFVYVYFIYVDLALIYRSYLFKYGGEYAAGSAPLGIKVYDGGSVAVVVPLGMWGAVVGHTMEEFGFSQMDNVHTVIVLLLQYDNICQPTLFVFSEFDGKLLESGIEHLVGDDGLDGIGDGVDEALSHIVLADDKRYFTHGSGVGEHAYVLLLIGV